MRLHYSTFLRAFREVGTPVIRVWTRTSLSTGAYANANINGAMTYRAAGTGQLSYGRQIIKWLSCPQASLTANNALLFRLQRHILTVSTATCKMVHTLPFGDLQVPVPGFGAMGLSSAMGYNLSYDEAEPVLLKAIELGCTFWDTAVC